jgi:polysaccharide export outer membrane protein
MGKYKTLVSLIIMIAISNICFIASAKEVEQDYYKIGPSDILDIIVWRETKLSRNDIVVRPDGRISLPLVNDIMAAGNTPVQLKEMITNSLKSYVENPIVYVIVKGPESYKVSVLGNVSKPGIYPILTKINVLQGIALAGGFSEWAKKDDITVLRGHGKQQKRFKVDYSDVIDGVNPKQNILLIPGDLIIVP